MIAVSIRDIGPNGPPKAGFRVDILQTGETRRTDSTGMAVFHEDPGKYTVRVHDFQTGGPALHTIDSAVYAGRGTAKSLAFFKCSICH